jgi:DNA primase catalytic core
MEKIPTNNPKLSTTGQSKDSNFFDINDIKEKILDLDIIEVIGKHTELKKAGANYKGLCPIHNEKTPSFTVSPGKNRWHCFGCSKGGNIIDFIIEKKGLSFIEAIKDLAADHNITLPSRQYTEEEKKTELQKESLFVVNKIAARHYHENLYKPENKEALNYVLSRWTDETIKLFQIGYAEASWDEFIKFSTQNSIDKEILLEAGLIKANKKGVYFDFFRDRIIFPIQDKYSRPIAFTGRILPEKNSPLASATHSKGKTVPEPKYLNTSETPIYKKGNILFGLNMALKSIREKQFAYLVEGNPDVIRLQELNINNVVAPMGTGLTSDQVKILKPMIKTIHIIGDMDPAGQKAVIRASKMFINEGIAARLIIFPEDQGKVDPDSFFKDKSEKEFIEYVSQKSNDFLIQFALYLSNKDKNPDCNTPDFKAKAIDELCNLVCKFEDKSLIVQYIDQLSQLIGPKKAWTDKIKSFQKENTTIDRAERIPGTVNVNDFERYGFYEDSDGYYFRTKSGIVKGCNFTMKPLFHIQSVLNAKRLYEIKNEYGHTEVIELLQKDLVALQSFKVRVESLGNFLWEASETELNKLKRYLYEKTETCIEITQYGWQKTGFWSWANGIFNSEFIHVDPHGIIRLKDKNYYLPPFSGIYKGEEGLFVSERKFIHRDDNKITLKDYSQRLIDVFGDNAMIALSFYFATLFRDYIVKINNFFPILNLFGPKGTGKTELAVSMMHFFGKGDKGPNMNNTTKAALADHVAQRSNALVHIDEYKNSVDYEKIEFLKGLWDGTGRTRMNMDKDKKKETTAVDCGIILSGQEMPTADIALFSRLIYLSFYKTEYSDEEKKSFTELKEIEKKGLTHITHELLSHRTYFIEHYNSHYGTISREITKGLGKDIIEDRLFRNWVMVLAAYSVLEDKIDLPFTRVTLIENAIRQLRVQQRETRNSNEIATFWSLVLYMYSDGLIQENVDFKINLLETIKTDLVNIVFDEPKNVIFIQHSRIIPLYRKHGKQHGEKILPSDSIDYYLRNDKRFLGKKDVAFKAVDPKTGVELTNPEGGKMRKITKAYAFIYDDLGITLHNTDPISPLYKEIKAFNIKVEEDEPNF